MTQFITSISPAASGYAGQVTRGFYDSTVETKEAAAALEFGVPVKLDATGKAAALTAGSDAVYGFTVREYGQADMSGKQTEAFVAVLRRGYIAVKVTGGTAAPGGKVYLTAAGAVTAASPSTTALAGATFCGKADANGIVEIAFNI